MIDEKTKTAILKDYNENHFSLREICEKYNIHSKSYVVNYVLNGKTRSVSEALKIKKKKYPESFKHSEETKKKMSEKRILWMKNNPSKTAWRLKNQSYPEKCFQNLLEENGFTNKYLIYREFSVFPYFIDFAFFYEKIAVEIDGSQHLKEERRLSDEKKDNLLLSNGWKILRITAQKIMYDKEDVLNNLNNLLNNSNIVYEKVGILEYPKGYQKVKRDENGLSEGEKSQRKVIRPSKEELYYLIKNFSFCEIGRKYNVSDTSIKKWCKKYGLPFRKKDLK